jgi:hypothetical protein
MSEEHTIRLSSIYQTSVDQDNGSVLIKTRDGGLYSLEFADDEHAYDLIESIALAQKWRIDAERTRLARALAPVPIGVPV